MPSAPVDQNSQPLLNSATGKHVSFPASYTLCPRLHRLMRYSAEFSQYLVTHLHTPTHTLSIFISPYQCQLLSHPEEGTFVFWFLANSFTCAGKSHSLPHHIFQFFSFPSPLPPPSLPMTFLLISLSYFHTCSQSKLHHPCLSSF